MFDQLRQIIQNDVGQRGLASHPDANLFTACADDLRSACESLAYIPDPRIDTRLLVLTGFPIVACDPICGETDGPLGALFLARALAPLGIAVTLAAEAWCVPALRPGLQHLGIEDQVSLHVLPTTREEICRLVCDVVLPTHVVSVERVGPSRSGECYSMRGADVTKWVAPVEFLFEKGGPPAWQTIGIGDGGNEIGMGKMPRQVIDANIPLGGKIASRVATDHLIVAGVSNWGAYALAAGVTWLRGKWTRELFDEQTERALLDVLVERGSLVDGVTGKAEPTVDGLTWETYAQPLRAMGELG